jgi:rhodanese-related sulfurtransferase
MQHINANNLKSMFERNEDILLVDVLPPDHYSSQHIPGAVNIPLSQNDFASAVERAAQSKEQKVVVYCANEDRDLSPKAAERLSRSGFENVNDFRGGIEEWKSAGFETTTTG